MLLPILFLALITCSLLAFGLAVAMTRRKRHEVEQRLSLLPRAARTAQPEALLAEKAKAPRIAQIERLLLLDSRHPWELKTGPVLLAAAAAAAAAKSWFLIHRFLDLPLAVGILVSAIAAFLAPRMILIRERRRTESEFTALFPDAVDAVARMLRAGLPVTAAFQMVCQEAPPPVNALFATLAGQLRIGITLEEALRRSSERILLPDFQFFACAILLQQSTGGNLLSTLESLSQMMRNRRSVQLRARAVTAEVRFSAYILGALPFLTIAALLVISPGYLTPLFADPRGHMILAMGGGGLALSAFAMRQMMRSVEDA